MKESIPHYQYKNIFPLCFLANLAFISTNIIRVILNDYNTKDLIYWPYKRSIAKAFTGTEMQSSTKAPKFLSNILGTQQIMSIYYFNDFLKFTSFHVKHKIYWEIQPKAHNKIA